jgi:hypothetical protein
MLVMKILMSPDQTQRHWTPGGRCCLACSILLHCLHPAQLAFLNFSLSSFVLAGFMRQRMNAA